MSSIFSSKIPKILNMIEVAVYWQGIERAAVEIYIKKLNLLITKNEDNQRLFVQTSIGPRNHLWTKTSNLLKEENYECWHKTPLTMVFVPENYLRALKKTAGQFGMTQEIQHFYEKLEPLAKREPLTYGRVSWQS